MRDKDKEEKIMEIETQCVVCGKWKKEMDLGLKGKSREFFRVKAVVCIACLMVREEMLVNQQKEKRGMDVSNDTGKEEGVEEHEIRLGIGEKRVRPEDYMSEMEVKSIKNISMERMNKESKKEKEKVKKVGNKKVKEEKKGQVGEEKSKINGGGHAQENGNEEESQRKNDEIQRDPKESAKETDIKGWGGKDEEKEKTDITRDENEDNKENKTERKHHLDKVEGVGEEKRNETATETMRSRERDIEDTGLRETDQLKEGREREIQLDEINLMDFTEIGVEQHIDINKETKTPGEVETVIGSRNEYEYGTDGKQIGQGARKKNRREETEMNNERRQRTIDDERDKENFKNKEDIELEDIDREMREEDEKLKERSRNRNSDSRNRERSNRLGSNKGYKKGRGKTE